MKDLNLRKAFPIVAATLGNKLGINVTVKGTTACTNGNEIRLPSYDGNDPGYKTVAWGFLAHEAAHIRYSDFSIYGPVTDKFRFSFFNVIEDIRIEMLINNLYPGTRFTIEKTVLHMIQIGGFRALAKEAHPAAVLHDYMLYHLRFVFLNQTALKTLAEQAESILECVFPVGMVTRLAGLLSGVADLASTQDALALTDRILTMLQEEEEKERQRQQKQSPSRDDSDDSSNGSADGSDPDDSGDQSNGSDDDPDRDDSGNQPKGADDDSDPEDSDDSSNGSADGSDSDDYGDQSSGSDDDLEPDDSGDQPKGSDDGSYPDDSDDPPNGTGNVGQGGQNANALRWLLDAKGDDIPDDIMETARKILEISEKEASDITFPAPQKPMISQSGTGLLAKVETETGRLRSAIQGIIQSERMNRPVYKDSGRKLDGRRLHRLFSNDARVFQRKTHRETPNTAIHLLIDRSPSMARTVESGQKMISVATEASLALSLSLEGVPGVNPGITAFPGYNGSPDHVIEILGHGQRVRPNVSNFAVPSDNFGSTPMTEAIWFCASALLACKESRKVLVVLTDGEPDDDIGTLDILKRCRASGIEDIGIGIGVDVRHLFTTSVLINDVKELRARLFQISKELLLAA